jgi:CheY-like chemotaxis protein
MIVPDNKDMYAAGVPGRAEGGRKSGSSDFPERTRKADAGTAPLSGRVLVVEDSIVNQKLTAAILRKMGFEADVAADGKEALAALKNHSYVLVLMDVQMPGMDGLDATRRIRAAEDRRQRTEHSRTGTENLKPGDEAAVFSARNQEPGTKNPRRRIPIIAMTAGSTDQGPEECIAAGMDHYVTKPVDPMVLKELLGRILSAKRG